MLKYERLPTSAEVWAVIRARHYDDLVVSGTISDPDSDHCRMMTEYVVCGADIPILGAETAWQKHPVNDNERVNENTEYWICVAKGNEPAE